MTAQMRKVVSEEKQTNLQGKMTGPGNELMGWGDSQGDEGD